VKPKNIKSRREELIAANAAREIAEKRLRTERHLGMTIADWRLKKRQEWKAVMSALDRYGFGAAYTPGGNDFYELQRSAARVADALQDDWVCW